MYLVLWLSWLLWLSEPSETDDASPGSWDPQVLFAGVTAPGPLLLGSWGGRHVGLLTPPMMLMSLIRQRDEGVLAQRAPRPGGPPHRRFFEILFDYDAFACANATYSSYGPLKSTICPWSKCQMRVATSSIRS